MIEETRDTRTSPFDDEHAADSVEAAMVLLLRAEDGGDWRPVVEWLARHPEAAKEVDDFLVVQQKLRPVVGKFKKPVPVPAGTAVGRYVLGEEIGRGGEAVVYRALDTKLDRHVALKLVRTGEASATERARFRYEAKVVAALRHPNIVTVHDSNDEGAEPYIVMPLMTGGSLAKRLKDLGPDRCRPANEAAEIVRAVALGVHHAHQRGLIHRDLKPANVLLDEAGAPHVADFGLARRVDVTLSTAGSISGTVPYMAPEQARGEAVLTTAVDVHALGAILFELLTGRPPFGTEGTMATLHRVAEEPAPSVRQFRPDVHRDLELICAKCLSKAPQDRYPSAEALAEDLKRFLNGEPPSGSGRGWVWGTVARALGWQREMHAMGSWRVAFWGAASTAFAMAVMQGAVLLRAPLWVSQVAIAYYLLAWLGLMWVFLVARRDALNPVERASTAIHFGAKFGCVAVLPVHLWLHGGDPVFALPSFLALVGLATFVHGATYWGRLYLSGTGILAAAAAMPLVPVAYWPTVYGAILAALQLLMGVHLRRVHRTAAATNRTNPN